MSTQPVVALLGAGRVDPDSPILRFDDLGALRGDGIFETIHVRRGEAWLLSEHLARMANSAALTQLALPDEAALIGLAKQALDGWPAENEGALRLVCTRGLDRPSAPVTVYAYLTAVAEPTIRARRDGVHLVTADLGRPAEAGSEPRPWLLSGAKTLSYALNMATLRWARSVGADDALWVSTDGYALEAPTSTLVWRSGPSLCTVPARATGILAGTTAAWLLAHAEELGFSTEDRMITPPNLLAADGAWLLSSIRGITAIRTLDGAALASDPLLTARLATHLGYA